MEFNSCHYPNGYYMAHPTAICILVTFSSAICWCLVVWPGRVFIGVKIIWHINDWYFPWVCTTWWPVNNWTKHMWGEYLFFAGNGHWGSVILKIKHTYMYRFADHPKFYNKPILLTIVSMQADQRTNRSCFYHQSNREPIIHHLTGIPANLLIYGIQKTKTRRARWAKSVTAVCSAAIWNSYCQSRKSSRTRRMAIDQACSRFNLMCSWHSPVRAMEIYILRIISKLSVRHTKRLSAQKYFRLCNAGPNYLSLFRVRRD